MVMRTCVRLTQSRGSDESSRHSDSANCQIDLSLRLYQYRSTSRTTFTVTYLRFTGLATRTYFTIAYLWPVQ